MVLSMESLMETPRDSSMAPMKANAKGCETGKLMDCSMVLASATASEMASVMVSDRVLCVYVHAHVQQ